MDMISAPWLRRAAHYWQLLGLILGLIVLRIILLPISPPGFYVDEAATGAHVVSMLHHGTNAHGQAWPLFSASLGGGYTTPVYLYPLVAWATVFGASEVALRAFSMFVTVATCGFIGVSVYAWLRSARLGLIATCVGLLLPWGWVQGSLAWDPAMVPLFVTLGLWATGTLLFAVAQKWRLVAHILLPLSMVALAYVYPPCRVTAPLLLVGAYLVLFFRKKATVRQLGISAGASLVAVVPLARFMIQPDALARSRELSVFHDSILSGMAQLLGNFAALLNPIFLFATGDANLRHATGAQGMLGVAAVVPCVALVWYIISHSHSWQAWRRHLTPPVLMGLVVVFGIAASFLGSALTSEGQPHSLRACAAWPFFVILISFGWQIISTRYEHLQKAALTIAVISLVIYVADLRIYYPGQADSAFDQPARRALAAHVAVPYPPLALQYYQQR